MSRYTYGSPRITIELREQGDTCSKNRVARIMRENDIKAKTARKFKVTTNSKHNMPISENLLNQNFSVSTPDRVWVSDITYIRTLEGWLYLSIILDLYSRKIIGWSVSDRITKKVVTDALLKAIWNRKPSKGLIVHSDQGSQYASIEFRNIIKRFGFKQSMSGKGNCYDNAVAESFFHTIKTECVYSEVYKSKSEAKSAIFDYIEIFYNRQRRHSTIGYMSPVDFEIKLDIEMKHRVS
jgi:transposase InsO family protein